MLRFPLLAVLLSASALGQSPLPDLRVEAGCGPSNIKFDVTTARNQPQISEPEPGKALVYIVEDVKNPSAMPFGQVTTRVGLDGSWVGANHGQSYMRFSADPGERRVCADWQSSLKSLQRLSGAATLNAEAGKTYFYRVEVTVPWTGRANERGDDQSGQLTLQAIDRPEGLLLISRSASSSWRAKK
jgi:hypothetical protein